MNGSVCQGNVFVADSGNDRIVELSPSGSQTVLPFAGLNLPDAVSVDSSGKVFVLDETNGGRPCPIGGTALGSTAVKLSLSSSAGTAVARRTVGQPAVIDRVDLAARLLTRSITSSCTFSERTKRSKHATTM